MLKVFAIAPAAFAFASTTPALGGPPSSVPLTGCREAGWGGGASNLGGWALITSCVLPTFLAPSSRLRERAGREARDCSSVHQAREWNLEWWRRQKSATGRTVWA